MCGRFVSTTDPAALASWFAADEVRTDPLPVRHNVAPTLDVYAVIERSGTRRLGALRWGLVPHWAKSLRDRPMPINARIEDITEKPMFATAFARRRCILPADGFYEWQRNDDGPRPAKQPWYLHDPRGAPLAFAGIWTVWRDPAAGDDAEPVFTTAIVTTAAAGQVAELHTRMPVMLPRDLWDEWLTAEPDAAGHLQQAVAALDAPDLRAYAVSERVNNVRNEGPELLTPA